ncbi:MAG TPA: SPOR domain-containing protein [Gemmatimonadales bacterium]|nr:SPOR domain-containing protein [Gemmatimonadales bacterium]
MGRHPRGLATGAIVVALAWAALPTLGRAQTEPRLAHAVRLAQEGASDSARTIVQRVLDATPATDTLYPQVLYARAVVSSNAQDMRRDLQRVTAEYAASTWADRALLRLAQLDYATNDLEGGARNLERLRLDYPASPIYAQAAFWAGRIYFDLRRAPSACRWLAEGLTRAGSDVELRNQLQFYNQRCAGVVLDTARTDSSRVDSTARAAVQPADSSKPIDSSKPAPDSAKAVAASPDTAARVSPAAPTASTAVFRIQVAAVNTRAAADSIAKRVKAGGFESIVATEKGLYKVRVGAYPTRAAAQAALAGVRAKLGGQAFVVGP